MLDKLALTGFQTITFEDACQQLKGLYSSYKLTGSGLHRLIASFRAGQNHLVTVHTQPRFRTVPPVKIELNPTTFRNIGDCIDLVGRLVDWRGLSVCRLDHAVDIPVSVENVFESLNFSRKKRRETYFDGTELTGFYLGTPPELLCVYDKARERKLSEPLTRIEVRQYRNKVPVTSLQGLPSLRHYSPFARIKFFEVDQSPSGENVISKTKRTILRETIHEFGAHGAYKILNRHSNFRRDFGRCLSPSKIPNLDAIYRANLSAFIGEEPHGY